MRDLIEEYPQENQIPETLSKRGFAERLSLSPGRITQLIDDGMPVRPNGRIGVKEGEEWYSTNIDPNRQRGKGTSTRVGSPKAELDRTNAERAKLRLEKERGNLVDRQSTERLLFERARAERDAWMGWTSKAASLLASEIDVDITAVHVVLDRLVRDQLRSLSETKIGDFDHE